MLLFLFHYRASACNACRARDILCKLHDTRTIFSCPSTI